MDVFHTSDMEYSSIVASSLPLDGLNLVGQPIVKALPFSESDSSLDVNLETSEK